MEKTRDKLIKETRNLESFKEMLNKSNKLTKTMVSILSNFDEKLSKLEETIGPVYKETGNLQQRQENLVKTLQSFDYVIPFYTVANDLEPIITTGPDSMPIPDYLDNMNKLKSAINYFVKNNPESPELMNVTSLHDKGAAFLLKKFRLLISNHSRPLAPNIIYCLVHEDDNQSELPKPLSDKIPEKDRAQLRLLSEWLVVNMKDQFISAYSSLRCEVVEKSLRDFKAHQKSSSGGFSGHLSSPAPPRKSLTPMKDNLPLRRNPKSIQQALKKKLQDVIPTEMLGGRSYHSVPHDLCELATSEREIECYLTSVTALYRLMQAELKLMEGIIPMEHQKLLFSRLVQPALDFVVNEGENIAGRVKKCSVKHDFSSALNLFPILRHQASMRHNFDLLFDGCSTDVQTKFQGLVVTLQTTLNKALEEFIEYIRNDVDTKVPRDGTVHELTSNVMIFLVQLSNYLDILSRVITVTDMQSYERSSDKNKLAFAQYISRVLQTLSLNLQLKSDCYADQYLKAIFKLNNIHYILKTLRKSSLLETLKMYNHEIDLVYEKQIMENKRIYSQSWSRVLHFVLEIDSKTPSPESIEMANMKLKEKDRQMIKDKFSGFNKEIEELRKVQKAYAIPDAELRESLKKDNAMFIVPRYEQFYKKYSNMAFSKNIDKYVKFSPNEVYNIIQSFFDATA
ncbi:exocyst complex component 7-like [Panonychus citri]|uniref:exocyst complex component 7-like n=1 Tax=Panonychus citri TaxID=50023 RepID=UPI0023079229|nr:exocyst complex component 7-like [Panonychus citri]